MSSKVFMVVLAFVALISVSFAAEPSLQCQFRTGSCEAGEVAVFYANEYFSPSDPVLDANKVLSSNVAIDNLAFGYNRPLCCYSPYGELAVNSIDVTESCDSGEVDLMYFTDESNARVAFDQYDSSSSFNFDINHYSKKMCIKMPVGFGSVKLVASDRDYAPLGYTCLYKTNSMENGLVSSCDSTFNGGDQYDFTIWGQIFESTNTLNCNTDCVSITTNRVYYECKEKLAECSDVPIQCNGALLGSWVYYNETHEVKCSKGWTEFRSQMFTETKLDVKSVDGYCQNLVSKKYSVIVDNEQVNLRVFVCED